MSNVWLTIPSARPLEEVETLLDKWRERGYKIALWRDVGAGIPTCDFAIEQPYPGYAIACNTLIRKVMLEYDDAEWFVATGDDTEPSAPPAEEIAEQLHVWFGGTFGVCQPTGDRDFGDKDGPYIDRVAGSPWIGREFARRMYQGDGPYWPEYHHMFVDQELMDVSVKLGVFWQRPDLTHKHNHWGRPKEGERMGHVENMPAHLVSVNTPEHWKKYKTMYESRKAAGFPGHEPIV